VNSITQERRLFADFPDSNFICVNHQSLSVLDFVSPKLENLSVLTAMLNFLITRLTFWNVTLYTQINRHQHFGGTWCLYFYPEDEANAFSKILVTLYQYLFCQLTFTKISEVSE